MSFLYGVSGGGVGHLQGAQSRSRRGDGVSDLNASLGEVFWNVKPKGRPLEGPCLPALLGRPQDPSGEQDKGAG